MSLIEIDNKAALVFTKVLDEMPSGPIEDDETEEAVDRKFCCDIAPGQIVLPGGCVGAADNLRIPFDPIAFCSQSNNNSNH